MIDYGKEKPAKILWWKLQFSLLVIEYLNFVQNCNNKEYNHNFIIRNMANIGQQKDNKYLRI